MPDDTDVSSSDDNDEQPCDLENNNLLLHDCSLTDMLRPTPSQHSDTVNVSDKESSSSVHTNSQHALFIELDHIKEANRRLQKSSGIASRGDERTAETYQTTKRRN